MCNFYPQHSIIISGDFNFPNINWNVPCPKSNVKLARDFVTCVLDNALTQYVSFPTCVTMF